MSRSLPRTAPPWMPSTRLGSKRAGAATARPASVRIIIRTITARSCSIPTVTTSKRCATRPADWLRREHRFTGAVIAPDVMERNMVNDNTASDLDRVWELMKKIGFPMLVTRDGDRLRARPMSAYLAREENAIYFLTDARRHKDEEIARDPHVNLSFADPHSQKYVSVTGRAIVANDRAKIRQLFSTPAK